jgi:Recombinase
LKGIAAALNARGIRTARGGRWYPTTVKNLRRRQLPAAAEQVAG